jgi:hypothetical protein
MVERLSAAGQHIALPDAIMITGTDDHDPPETMITINWIERSRWSGIGDHDRPECAARTEIDQDTSRSDDRAPSKEDTEAARASVLWTSAIRSSSSSFRWLNCNHPTGSCSFERSLRRLLTDDRSARRASTSSRRIMLPLRWGSSRLLGWWGCSRRRSLCCCYSQL